MTSEERIEATRRELDAIWGRSSPGCIDKRADALKNVAIRLLKELAEARERATAAEAERDEWKALGADTPEALKTIMDLAIDTAVGHNRRLKSERNQLRAELERERGRLNAILGGWIHDIHPPSGTNREIIDDAMEELKGDAEFGAAMGVAEEPTGGKPE